MAEETTQATEDPETGALDAPTEVASAVSDNTAPAPTTEAAPPTSTAAQTPVETQSAQEPDAIQPLIDKAFETIEHGFDNAELGKFLRAHIKTFHEEFDALSPNAKDAYVHMMTSQLLQRKAAATQIGIGNEFKLPVPSAQTQLFESIKQSQVRPQKRQPVLLMPPNLRPTYSLKK